MLLQYTENKIMASLLAMGASAAINALAFSGTNYIFSTFSDHGEAEPKFTINLNISGLETKQ